MSNNFFKSLAKRKLLDDYAPALDWYLSSEHFKRDNWNNYIHIFTKKIKQLAYLEKIDFKYGKEGIIKFPTKREHNTKIILEQTNPDCKSLGKDFVRHIRNGIAHGRAKITKIKSNEFIEIKDYKDSKQILQTAYILIPKECLKDIYDIYLKIDKKINDIKK